MTLARAAKNRFGRLIMVEIDLKGKIYGDSSCGGQPKLKSKIEVIGIGSTPVCGSRQCTYVRIVLYVRTVGQQGVRVRHTVQSSDGGRTSSLGSH